MSGLYLEQLEHHADATKQAFQQKLGTRIRATGRGGTSTQLS